MIKRTESQEITIDFLEIDHIRDEMKKLSKQFKAGRTKQNTNIYKYSQFYIGRTVSNIRFSGIKQTGYTTTLAARLKQTFPEYKVYTGFDSITVYLRGEKHVKA